MRVVAPAKLNLCLRIVGKRPDGFHLLQSLVMFAEAGDTLEIAPAHDLTLELQGVFAAGLKQDSADNLVLRAAKALQARHGITKGAKLRLDKNLPIGAGFGGGSSDAAAALKALCQFWEIKASLAELEAIAEELGSDVKSCLRASSLWMEGVGEELSAVNVAFPIWVVLVHPRKPLLTADVYRAFKPPFATKQTLPPKIANWKALLALADAMPNALQAPALGLMAEIAQVLDVIGKTDACKLARMSGSGAGCFGLYDNEMAAKTAATYIASKQPNWWCIASSLRTNHEA